jgi:DNA-binding NarL/FixJ family response regulator
VTKPPRRVLVVDDDVLLASLVKKSLTSEGFEVETAASAAEGRRKVTTFDPDLVLLDLALGAGPSGVHLAHALTERRPDVAILVLTKYSDAQSATSDGVDIPSEVGFLRKQLVTEPNQLVAAIEQVLADRPDEIRHDKNSRRTFPELPEKGLLVLRLLSEGHSNQEISKRASLSVKSVERWLERIYREMKLDTDGSVNLRVAAVRRYLKETGASDRG